MLDFVSVGVSTKGSRVIVGPDFKVMKSKDLMVKGKSFYAIWDEAAGRWSTDEYDVQRLIDAEIELFANKQGFPNAEVRYLRDNSSGIWAIFKNYLKNLADHYKELDNVITFSSDQPRKNTYCSKSVNYVPTPGEASAYHRLMGILYSDEEKRKFEWAIGAVLLGEARRIQKFVALYGEPGSGKGTVLNIIQQLFDGYTVSFDAGELTSKSNSFSTEVFRTNPLVAIQHDSDLSKIESNTKLNSIVSHEELVLNEKYKPQYSARINAFLFLGTNSPVKISDARSGLIRRLLDVSPTGNTLPSNEYDKLIEQVKFELGFIAQHCMTVYNSLGRAYYSTYRPMNMIYKTDVFFNFVETHAALMRTKEGVGLRHAYDLYKQYCDDSLLEFKLPLYKFREELKVYFEDYDETEKWYRRFISAKFCGEKTLTTEVETRSLTRTTSTLDTLLANSPAQLASEKEIPTTKWSSVTTVLSDIDTHQLHYVKLPNNHIVIDFDLKDESGQKSFALNLAAAKAFPLTYAEVSKSGSGLHLHYIYDGDVSQLAKLYAPDIEIKVFSGDAALRRKLTKCNSEAVCPISGGLPIKETTMIHTKSVETERHLRALIQKALRKEIHPGTKSNVDFIHKVLLDAYTTKMIYDVSDLRPVVIAFAAQSTHHSEDCLTCTASMKFKSEIDSVTQNVDSTGACAIFDVEVYPNLFVVVWKKLGGTKVEMINPSPQEIAALFDLKLIGFNNRRYDNHILYARYLGYSNEELYQVSRNMIRGAEDAFFSEAYELSYLDLFDISSKKQSLKKFEVELGILHMELDFPWDQPVPEEFWPKVVTYCGNDVDATEIVYKHIEQDISARLILSKLSGLIPNKPTRLHAAQIIFGNQNKKQNLVYADLSQLFPGYCHAFGKSEYKNEVPGEGGYVYAEPGIYDNITCLDIASMHPHSIIALNLFGETGTKNFQDLVQARLAIKHERVEELKHLLGGALFPFLGDKHANKALSYSLKIVINMIYGFTSAKFENAFRDPRNMDNIVAKRGALFMIDLKKLVQDHGFRVVHIKTDSIKIPDATPEIIGKILKFGEQYGYHFEVEHASQEIIDWCKNNGQGAAVEETLPAYSIFCLVNDAVSIAKSGDNWHAVGAQFQHPIVFKTLFSKEEIFLEDYFETKQVTTHMVLKSPESQRFIGKIGRFAPVIEGCSELMRVKDDKFYAVTGTKGYFWEEASLITDRSQLDQNYYDKLINDALLTIQKFGDPSIFTTYMTT